MESEVQIHLAEYEGLRDEMALHINRRAQTTVLALGSVSVLVPLLLTQMKDVPTSLIVIILYLFSIVYSILGMDYASSASVEASISLYINVHLGPVLGELTKTSGVLHWERFVRGERHRFAPFFLTGVGSVGSIVLILLPGLIVLLVAGVLPSTPVVAPAAADVPVLYTVHAVLRVASWGLFAVAAGANALAGIYWLRDVGWAKA